MTVSARTNKSIRKKDIQGQRDLSVYKRIQFAHKSSGNESGINLSSLTAPSVEMPGFVQATLAEINSSNLLFNKKNLTLISTARGVLIPYKDYTVASNTRINFTDSFGTSLVNEIFIGALESTDRIGSAAIADIDAIVSTGTLTAGQTDIVVGKPYEVNKFSAAQIGSIMVFINGQLQYRNVGNAVASPSADGNYEELNTVTVRVNEAFDVDVPYVVVSNGFLAIRPTDSIMAEIESVAGQVDRIVDTLAEITELPASTWQGAPNSEDNKAFAERVIGLEEPGSPGRPKRATDTEYGAVLLDPTVMSDVVASRLGLKRYLNGTSYNGGNTPSTTSALAGFTVTLGHYIPYQMQDGTWRMKFNLTVNFNDFAYTAGNTLDFVLPFSVSNLSGDLDRVVVSGHASQSVSPFWQEISASIQTNSNSLSVRSTNSYTITGLGLLGDVPLASKPNWVY